MRSKKLVFRAEADSRAAKYRHGMDERWGLGKAGKALLAVLLLRGPQTPEELRARTERMHVFPDVAAAERTLNDLAEETEPPLWEKLPPAPGRKRRGIGICQVVRRTCRMRRPVLRRRRRWRRHRQVRKRSRAWRQGCANWKLNWRRSGNRSKTFAGSPNDVFGAGARGIVPQNVRPFTL